jgi:hypothetical protein
MISTGEDDTVRDIVFRLIMFVTGLNFVIGRCNCVIKGKDLFAPSSLDYVRLFKLLDAARKSAKRAARDPPMPNLPNGQYHEIGLHR